MIRLVPFSLAWFILICTAAVGAENLPASIAQSDYRSATPAQIKLGQLLFYDRILSGSYRVSCATCHNHDRASSNGFLLAGKQAVAPDTLAVNGLAIYDAFKPSSRHAPALFNVGAKEFQTLFSDGRVARLNDGSYLAPQSEKPENQLPLALRDVLAVQALFPAVTGEELVGRVESDLKTAAHFGNQAIWDALARRIQNLPEYLPYFNRAYGQGIRIEDITITHIANAISSFVGNEWQSFQSPFDAYSAGDKTALTASQISGMNLFYSKANCASCHAGKFQTDHKFYNIALPAWRFNEEKPANFETRLMGRYSVTQKSSDRFRRRTPSLRNVAHTAPYGSFGGIESLEGVVRHHLNPRVALGAFAKTMKTLGANSAIERLLSRVDITEVELDYKEFSDLISFLHGLTDKKSLSGRLGKPNSVPSSLALD